MQICSPCFPKPDSLRSDGGLNYVSFCCKNKLNAEKKGFEARFYCCGGVTSEGSFKKRHGMCDFDSLNNEKSIELAVDALEFTNLKKEKIVNPNIPFIEYLPEELCEGKTVEIQGKLSENASRFSINFSTGKDSSADVAFHFNPRLDRRLIIRNHKIKNKWGIEEILSLQPFPFVIGRSFSVLIFVADEQFFVAINRIHYCAFTFRIPVEKIKCLIVTGDVILNFVQFHELLSYPPQNLKKIPKIVIPHSLKFENTKCDIRRKVKKICVGTKIDIFGRLKLLPQAFYVNLQKGISLWPHSIIPFHMNLRFHPPGTHKREKEIIFNSWTNGFWGKEEIISYCPFLPGTKFHIRIICKVNGFSVWVNEKMLFNYQRTTVDSEVDSVVLHGDIVVNKVVVH